MNSKSIVCITLLLTFLCGAYTQDISVEDLMSYNKWRQSNKRSYLNEEEQIFRQLVFFENLKSISDHNSNPSNTYTAGINQFSDMTQEEFVSKILNNKLSEQQQGFQSSGEGLKLSGAFQQSPSVDWRTKGAVTPIKNQGSCGSCWTFSTAALMESVNYIKNGKASNFAEQQLLDCVTSSYGCNGGFPIQALNYAVKTGIVDETQYPYVGTQGRCKVTGATTGFKPKSVVRVGRTSTDLKNALNQSPVAVVVDATNWSNYRSGIFSNCSTNTNHAVLAVGYDASGNWIIKNSWGTGWGESGYMRLAAGNTCNVLSDSQIVTA